MHRKETLKVSERFYTHLSWTGVTSEGNTEWEPDPRPGTFIGYGFSPQASYAAARRAMIQHFRDREEREREATRKKYLDSRDARVEAGLGWGHGNQPTGVI